MKRTMSILTVIASIGFSSAGLAGEECGMHVFGDSLSDVGKKSAFSLYTLSDQLEPPSWPYKKGRFTNGRVWVEYLKDYVCPQGPFASYAAGGAFTDERNLDELIAPDAGGLATQVARVEDGGVTFTRDDVIVLWAGANDYVFGAIALAPPNAVDVVWNVVDAVERLAARGATRFVLPNMPDLGGTPLGRTNDELAAALSALSQGHNAVLGVAVEGLVEAGLDITVVDVASLFATVQDHPENFGFHDVAHPCLIQQPDLSRIPSGLCPEQGKTYDATGFFF